MDERNSRTQWPRRGQDGQFNLNGGLRNDMLGRYSLRLEFQLPHANLCKPLATDQNWPNIFESGLRPTPSKCLVGLPLRSSHKFG